MLLSLKTKCPNPYNINEDDSKAILQLNLPADIRSLYPERDYPNIDGYFEIFNKNGSAGCSLKFQLRTNRKCEISFLNYCYNSDLPVIFIFVDLRENKVYWEYINKLYISRELSIDDLGKLNPESKKTIRFKKDKVILRSSSFSSALLHICKEHKEKIIEEENYKKEVAKKDEPLIVGRYVEKSKKVLDNQNIKKSDLNKFKKVFEDFKLKKKYYLALVFLLSPVFINEKSKRERQIIYKLFDIEAKEETELIKELASEGYIRIKSEIIVINKKGEAEKNLTEMIEKMEIPLENLVKLFL